MTMCSIITIRTQIPGWLAILVFSFSMCSFQFWFHPTPVHWICVYVIYIYPTHKHLFTAHLMNVTLLTKPHATMNAAQTEEHCTGSNGMSNVHRPTTEIHAGERGLKSSIHARSTGTLKINC